MKTKEDYGVQLLKQVTKYSEETRNLLIEKSVLEDMNENDNTDPRLSRIKEIDRILRANLDCWSQEMMLSCAQMIGED